MQIRTAFVRMPHDVKLHVQRRNLNATKIPTAMHTRDPLREARKLSAILANSTHFLLINCGLRLSPIISAHGEHLSLRQCPSFVVTKACGPQGIKEQEENPHRRNAPKAAHQPSRLHVVHAEESEVAKVDPEVGRMHRFVGLFTYLLLRRVGDLCNFSSDAASRVCHTFKARGCDQQATAAISSQVPVQRSQRLQKSSMARNILAGHCSPA